MYVVRLNEPKTRAPTLENQFRFSTVGTVKTPPTDSAPWNWTSVPGDLLSVFSGWPFNLMPHNDDRRGRILVHNYGVLPRTIYGKKPCDEFRAQ